jgi:Na+-translocating ferredoxin:NAD+ oxidoreductase RnfD subunit
MAGAITLVDNNTGLAPDPIDPAGVTVAVAAPSSVKPSVLLELASCTLNVASSEVPLTFTNKETYAFPPDTITDDTPLNSFPTYAATWSPAFAYCPEIFTSPTTDAGIDGYVTTDPNAVGFDNNTGLDPEPIDPAGVTVAVAAPSNVKSSILPKLASYTLNVASSEVPFTFTNKETYAFPPDTTTGATPLNSLPTYAATLSPASAYCPEIFTSDTITAGMFGYVTGSEKPVASDTPEPASALTEKLVLTALARPGLEAVNV